MSKRIAMIPARMGSQRLKHKNLQPFNGMPLISWAVRRCLEANIFDEVWINSEDDAFAPVAKTEGARFHKRPQQLGDNDATSEQFVAEFLHNHTCDLLFQVHSIAPLLTAAEIRQFVVAMTDGGHDAFMSVVEENLECVHEGRPVNFSFNEKTNSQDLVPVQRIVWAITGWRYASFLAAHTAGRCATYAGRVGYFPVNRMAGHVIKTQEDLDVATALFGISHNQQHRQERSG
ncbi:acylneuraminate cytidylyltransferase family protein [Kordiimonas aestuarii]|uniref:acylneuraminate cytidylyltransferase family protein n=1 Tax=Kordiimonas aestuarii TaxID=1005925 RepID=UPI0021D1507A|nr:NTP transferase domain-containing protein [Kordiimonas aestuarii]